MMYFFDELALSKISFERRWNPRVWYIVVSIYGIDVPRSIGEDIDGKRDREERMKEREEEEDVGLSVGLQFSAP